MYDMAFERSERTLVPNTWASPELALTNEEMMPISVDLPAPFGPSRAKKSPSSTVSETPLSASTPFL